MVLNYSSKLVDLWDRIVEKDDEDQAVDAFQEVCVGTYNTDSETADDLLNEGARLQEDLSEGNQYFTYEYEDGTLYVFEGKNENQVYNQILRAWCTNTDRKIKGRDE